MPKEQGELLRVTMIAPTRVRCGVTDYTAYLAAPLSKRTDLRGPIDPAQYRAATDDSEIVHIQHQYFFFGGVAPWKNRFRSFCRSLRHPAVMTVHEFVTPDGPPHVRAAIRLTNRMQFGRRELRRLIVHTHEDRRRLAAAGFDSSRIEVVRHGVPQPLDLPETADAKRSLGLEGRFVVTIFGFLSRRKGHGMAIEAIGRVPDRAVLLLAGGRHPDDTSDYPDMLKTMIASEGLEERVRITGYLPPEDVSLIMAATDIAAAPFTESSGSGSLALAMACGKAILASDITAHQEITDEFPEAIRLVRADPADWSAAISALMTSDSERRVLESGARGYAEGNSYDRMAEETVRVYRRILDERPA